MANHVRREKLQKRIACYKAEYKEAFHRKLPSQLKGGVGALHAGCQEEPVSCEDKPCLSLIQKTE